MYSMKKKSQLLKGVMAYGTLEINVHAIISFAIYLNSNFYDCYPCLFLRLYE